MNPVLLSFFVVLSFSSVNIVFSRDRLHASKERNSEKKSSDESMRDFVEQKDPEELEKMINNKKKRQSERLVDSNENVNAKRSDKMQKKYQQK